MADDDDAPVAFAIVDRDAADVYLHKWYTGLVGTVVREPCFLCFSCVCFPCSNVRLRRDVLGGEMKHYRCFQHHFLPCVGRCIPCQRVCPSACLVLEAHCCPVLSALATRHVIQDKFKVRSTCLEVCCLRLLCVCECVLKKSDAVLTPRNKLPFFPCVSVRQ